MTFACPGVYLHFLLRIVGPTGGRSVEQGTCHHRLTSCDLQLMKSHDVLLHTKDAQIRLEEAALIGTRSCNFSFAMGLFPKFPFSSPNIWMSLLEM